VTSTINMLTCAPDAFSVQRMSSNEAPWHEDPEFWSTMRDGVFDPQLWADAERDVDQLLALTGVASGARVLDIPCGPGRHLLALAARGFEVCGVDLTRAYLAEAQKRLDIAQRNAELIFADMREFARSESFDLAINLYTSFGYSKDPNDDHRMLRNLYDSLRRGGQLVMELVTSECAIAEAPQVHELGEGCRIVEHAPLLLGNSVIQRRWELQRPGGSRSWLASHRLYSVTELAALLEQCGFTRVDVHGALDGRPFSEGGDGAVFVARRAS
jgi:SAM-dependent methyltransferase